MNISNPGLGFASYGSGADALGPSDAEANNSLTVVSLGDGGRITLTFARPIANGPGADFAVFENGITDNFLELAFVEVSSDGTNFTRFHAVSLTQTATQVGPFDQSIDPTDLYNLAGKYRVGFGTPFDLAELVGTPGLDINAVTHVRIVDVVGSIDPLYGTRDSLNNLINDPWPTAFDTGGFDLDAVGVLNFAPVPEPSSIVLLAAAALCAAVRRRR
ncbi:MAG: PEP-CTERM sorting domain-containing protein [Chthoniobacteraceae bacterium]